MDAFNAIEMIIKDVSGSVSGPYIMMVEQLY